MASTSCVFPFAPGLQLSREAHDSQALDRVVITQAVAGPCAPILMTMPCSTAIGGTVESL